MFQPFIQCTVEAPLAAIRLFFGKSLQPLNAGIWAVYPILLGISCRAPSGRMPSSGLSTDVLWALNLGFGWDTQGHSEIFPKPLHRCLGCLLRVVVVLKGERLPQFHIVCTLHSPQQLPPTVVSFLLMLFCCGFSSGLDKLPVLSSNLPLTILFDRVVRNKEYMCDNLPQPELVSSNVLFCPTNTPKPGDIQFISMYDKENHQILTSEKLEPASVSTSANSRWHRLQF